MIHSAASNSAVVKRVAAAVALRLRQGVIMPPQTAQEDKHALTPTTSHPHGPGLTFIYSLLNMHSPPSRQQGLLLLLQPVHIDHRRTCRTKSPPELAPESILFFEDEEHLLVSGSMGNKRRLVMKETKKTPLPVSMLVKSKTQGEFVRSIGRVLSTKSTSAARPLARVETLRPANGTRDNHAPDHH